MPKKSQLQVRVEARIQVLHTEWAKCIEEADAIRERGVAALAEATQLQDLIDAGSPEDLPHQGPSDKTVQDS